MGNRNWLHVIGILLLKIYVKMLFKCNGIHIIVRIIITVLLFGKFLYVHSLIIFSHRIIFSGFALNSRRCKVKVNLLLHLLITIQYANSCANLLPSYGK